MKTNQLFRAALVALFFTFSLGACKKGNDPEPQASIVFWTKNAGITTTKADCYIDGKLIGTLNKTTSATPNCNEATLPTTKVAPGTHQWEFRVANGRVVKDNFDATAGMCYDIELY